MRRIYPNMITNPSSRLRGRMRNPSGKNPASGELFVSARPARTARARFASMPDSAQPSIVLVEDHALVRQLLALLVREHLDATLAGEAATVAEGLALARRERPDLMVVDWALSDGSAADLVRPLAAELPGTRWLIVSSREDESVLRAALALGVHGFVLKQSPLETFRDAMRKILSGDSFYCPRSSRLLMESLRSEAPVLGTSLTFREREVLRGIASGLNPKEIAAAHGTSPKTVQNQISQLKDKLGIREPAGLVNYALNHGLLRSE